MSDTLSVGGRSRFLSGDRVLITAFSQVAGLLPIQQTWEAGAAVAAVLPPLTLPSSRYHRSRPLPMTTGSPAHVRQGVRHAVYRVQVRSSQR